MLLKILFSALLYAAIPVQLEFTVLSEGFVAKGVPYKNGLLVGNQKGLEMVWGHLGLDGAPPKVNFSVESVILIVHDSSLSSGVKIMGVEKTDEGINIKYIVNPPITSKQIHGSSQLPYIIAKYPTATVENDKITIIRDLAKIPSGSALGQKPEYSNVLSAYSGKEFENFFPLDKGNSWTYRVEKGTEEPVEQTFRVISTSESGWSHFDKFFGREQVALRIPPRGDLMVFSDETVQSFYTADIQKNYDSTDVITPAGTFSDIMQISIPKNENFWFKDIYAKGVGLVYHEHEGKKGSVKLTLIKAHVRGTEFPKATN